MRPLTYAAWQGLIEPVNILLQSGASPNEPSREGETPLHFSCQHGHVDVVCLWWYQKRAWLQFCSSAVHKIQFLSHCNAYMNKMRCFLEGVWKTDLGRAHLICPAMFVFVRVLCPSFSCQINVHVHLSGRGEETFFVLLPHILKCLYVTMQVWKHDWQRHTECLGARVLSQPITTLIHFATWVVSCGRLFWDHENAEHR